MFHWLVEYFSLMSSARLQKKVIMIVGTVTDKYAVLEEMRLQLAMQSSAQQRPNPQANVRFL